MLFERPDDDILYDALVACDAAYEGFAYAAVKTTGIFCRLTCPAREPKREKTRFYGTTGECLEVGFARAAVAGRCCGASAGCSNASGGW